MIRVMMLSALPASPLAAQDTVRFTPTVQQPTFAVREPVLRIRPGTVLVSRTHFGPYYTEAGGAFPGEDRSTSRARPRRTCSRSRS
jgi:hypothetical protein